MTRSEINHRYYEENKERLLARKKITNRLRYLRKREELLNKHKLYIAANRDKAYAQQKQYRSARKAEKKIYNQKYRETNRETLKQKDRIKGERYYRINRSEILARHKLYHANNRHVFSAAMKKRRALEKKAAINLAGIKDFIRLVKAKRFVTCYYCQQPIPSIQIHFDHIVPLSKGGEHSIRNICVACPRCNLTKGRKQVDAWITVGQQLMRL